MFSDSLPLRETVWETVFVRAFFLHIAAACFMAIPVASLAADADPDAAWQKAYRLQEEKKFDEAAAEWQLALTLFEQQQRPASSAHWNLGLCCLNLQLPDCTAYHWLKSIEQSSSYLHIAQVTQALGQFQSSLGISNNVAHSVPFFFATNIGINTAWIAASLAAWFFVAFMIRWGRSRNIPRLFWFIASGTALGICGVSWFSTHYLNLYKSVGRLGEEVAIYSGPDGKSQLAQLPAGTIVLIDSVQDGYRRITAPVPGWVSVDQFSRPFSELRDSLRGAKHSAAR